MRTRAAQSPIKPKWGAKEFPYKQFLTCYSCGASVVGEEKVRHYKNGNVSRFVYYHCSRQVDHSCREPFVREQDIAYELTLMCNELITELAQLEPGLQQAIEKFNKIMRVADENFSPTKIIGSYVKYVLAEGTKFEKTRLIRNLDIRLALNDRKLVKILER